MFHICIKGSTTHFHNNFPCFHTYVSSSYSCQRRYIIVKFWLELTSFSANVDPFLVECEISSDGLTGVTKINTNIRHPVRNFPPK